MHNTVEQLFSGYNRKYFTVTHCQQALKEKRNEKQF